MFLAEIAETEQRFVHTKFVVELIICRKQSNHLPGAVWGLRQSPLVLVFKAI